MEKHNNMFFGVYEIIEKAGPMFQLHEFIELLEEMPLKKDFELDYIVECVQKLQGKKVFADDFSLLQIIFGL
jgi:hypothetical protein